jgi:glycosyltransferase involved in cell wall biosynthesis
MPKYLFTACLIVRNEVKVLPRCLNSIRAVCEEVCIVDTGSRDGTPDLARSHGANVVTFTGCNDAKGKMVDFSAARNRCLSMATGQWILSIDADEVLSPSSIEPILGHAKQRGLAAIRVCMRSKGSEWLVPRIFRSSPKHRFVGRVHEAIPLRGKIVTDRSIVITNLPNKRGKESSLARDLRICPVMITEDPADERAVFYLARALLGSGKYDLAIRQYKRYLELDSHFKAGKHAALQAIALCHLLSGRGHSAVRSAVAALRVDSRLAETHCLLADAYIAISRFDAAIKAYESAIACGSPPSDYPLFTDSYYYFAYPARQLKRFQIALE